MSVGQRGVKTTTLHDSLNCLLIFLMNMYAGGIFSSIVYPKPEMGLFIVLCIVFFNAISIVLHAPISKCGKKIINCTFLWRCSLFVYYRLLEGRKRGGMLFLNVFFLYCHATVAQYNRPHFNVVDMSRMLSLFCFLRLEVQLFSNYSLYKAAN